MEIKYQELIEVVSKAIKVDTLADDIINGLRNIEIKGFPLKGEDFIDMVYLFSSVIKSEYQFELKTVASTILGIVYVILPIDIIPDFLGPLGYTDDIAIVSLICKMIQTELNIYRKTELYRMNRERGFDIKYMFPIDKFKLYFTSEEFSKAKAQLKTLLPTKGSIDVGEASLVQYNDKKQYNSKGYQNETIAFFPGSMEEVIYVFNDLLYDAGGTCILKEKDLFERIILPSNETINYVKKVLANADKFYDFSLFANFEKEISSKLSNTIYDYTYEVIALRKQYFEMSKPKIDCYDDFNVYNVVYKAKLDFINWKSIYEIINIIRKAKSQDRFKVNYLILLSDNSSSYKFNYNSESKKVRVSTFNSRDMFFERELENLINSKLKTSILQR